jgi:hypothetical protein
MNLFLLNLDCGFAVVSFIVVVYDCGEQGNSDYRQSHWCPCRTSTDIRARGMLMWLLEQPSHYNGSLVWVDLGEQSRNLWLMHLILGRGNAGPSWLSYISVCIAVGLYVQLAGCADLKCTRCDTLEYHSLCKLTMRRSWNVLIRHFSSSAWVCYVCILTYTAVISSDHCWYVATLPSVSMTDKVSILCQCHDSIKLTPTYLGVSEIINQLAAST